MVDDNGNGSDSSDDGNQDEKQDRMERAASEVISEKLGLELDEDGKVDFEKLDEDALQSNAAELIPALIKTYAEQVGAEGGLTQTVDFFKALSEQLERLTRSGDIKSLEGLGRISKAFEAWADGAKKRFSTLLANTLGLQLNNDGIFDVDSLNDPEHREKVAKRIVNLADSVVKVADEVKKREQAKQVDSQREKDEPILPGVEDGESEEADNVIDLNEFRRRSEEKQSSMTFKIGDSLQETITNFIEEHIAGAQDPSNLRLNLDEKFFKEHGSALLTTALKDLSKSIIPPKIEINLPMPATKDAPPTNGDEVETSRSADEAVDGEASAADSEEDASSVKVALKLDLASLFKSWFKTSD